MIKIKVTMRGGRVQVKCKAVSELAVSMHEIELVNNSNMQGLMTIDSSSADLAFACPCNGCMALDKWISQIKGRVSFAPMFQQVFGLVQQLLDRGMDVGKACFHPGLVFIEPQKMSLYFMYLPYNGYGHAYDPILFLKDLARMPGMDAGMFAQRLFALRDISGLLEFGRALQVQTAGRGIQESFARETRGEADVSYTWNQREEQPTGSSEEAPFAWAGEEQPTGIREEAPFVWAGEEPPTGINEEEHCCEPIWEEEPLTGMREEEPYSGMGQEEPPTGIDGQNWGNTNPGMRSPMLIRLNTQESQPINKSPFIIGRSQQRADFHIPDNPKIGNVHAVLLKNGNAWYLEDSGSKNGTFVGGQRLVSGQRAELYHNMEFFLFNEGFRVQL